MKKRRKVLVPTGELLRMSRALAMKGTIRRLRKEVTELKRLLET